MKRNILFITISLVAIAILSNSCKVTQSETGSDIDEALKAIAESNDIYFQSFAKNDPSIFIDRYAPDCCIMPPNSPAICGADAPLAFFKLAYNKFGLRNGKFITTLVYGNGNGYVTEEGLWQSFNADGKLFDDGKFLVLWKKTSKGWKMYRDSFSSNRQQ